MESNLFAPTYKEGLHYLSQSDFLFFKFKFRLFNDKKAISAAFNIQSTMVHFSGHGNGSNSEREAAKLIFSDGLLG